MAGTSLIERFVSRAGAVQCEVLVTGSLIEACDKLVDCIGEAAPVVISGFDGETTSLIERRLSDEGIKCHVGSVRDLLPGFSVAVTPGHAGISETGTVVIESTSEDVRLASMLADRHFILMPSSTLYSELPEVESLLEEMLQRPGAYVAFITGPSRTADIERVLTIGVHGPREVTVILYGE
ncbi:LutC/YkgG family protein [Thermodesulforhabdus norvegica]|uniref:L-lactate dehydrogenase complex protein LldG n=1 Tax=Thermodesulforhabdus norvegica TaxID=39841 RepID=A0A1I4W7E0_9BACT|nr:lactate utilization protein [Thermodesulforhabdus norvegica]SFN09277.1 L-lactate dehydrogenase complex protein LldG [Thermodesulforhabdus norvegica]